MEEKTCKIITLGCKVNQYESAALEERLLSENWRFALPDEAPDLTIINTCIVTGRASYQSRQEIRKAVREKRDGIVAVTGCYPQVFYEEISGIEGVDIIIGNAGKSRIPDLLIRHTETGEKLVDIAGFGKGMPFEPLTVKGFENRTRAFLKIQDGCESFCSYCIVPFARGPLRSLHPDRVIDSLREFACGGYKEVVLTGIHLGKYGAESGNPNGLEKLLVRIGKERLNLRVRLSSLEPIEITHDLIDMVAGSEWLCRHFHIPMQSGDKNILKMMNRHYSPDDFRRLVESIHKKIPVAAIGVDVITGFPGEDENAFENSRSLIDDLPISYLHVFPFSPRQGTPAAGFSGQVNSRIIKERAQILRDLGKKKRMKFYESCLNKEFTVLTEGWHSEEKGIMNGLSDNYLPVIFSSNVSVKNELVRLVIEKVENEKVVGRVIRCGQG